MVFYSTSGTAISIHALVKRATFLFVFSLFVLVISIHALVKRATLLSVSVFLFLLYFNPRPREEGDFSFCFFAICVGDFNPRPREEGDASVLLFYSFRQVFQSTPS